MQPEKKLSIAEFLMSVREGGAIEELRATLEEATQAVLCTGKAGKVSLNISIKPNGTSKVFIKDDVKATIPKADSEETLYFVTDDGGLSRRDPRQLVLGELSQVSDN